MSRFHPMLIFLASACFVTPASAQRRQELKLYPPGRDPDYLQVWRDANAAAAHWRPDAKVYYIKLDIEPESKTLGSGEFRYFAPTGGRRNDWTESRQVQVLTPDGTAKHLVATLIDNSSPAPEAAPANLVDPMAHFDGIDPRLAESRPGRYIRFEMYRAGGGNPKNVVGNLLDYKFLAQVAQWGEWVWAAHIRQRDLQGFLYIDATTGEAHTACYSFRPGGGEYTVVPCTVRSRPAEKSPVNR